MSKAKSRKARRGPTAMTPEQIQRIQQLRRCGASGPQTKSVTRGAEKKAAIKSGW